MRRRIIAIVARRDGVAAIEFAIVLSLLIFVALGLIEFSRAIWTQATLDYAVQATARWASMDVETRCTDTLVKAYAAGKAPGISLERATFHCALPSATNCDGVADSIKVSAGLPFEFILPALQRYSATLTASACYGHPAA